MSSEVEFTCSACGAEFTRFVGEICPDCGEPWPLPPSPVLIVTMNEVPGHRIVEVHGQVFGLIVRARNYFSNIGASMRTLVGGEVAGYSKLLTVSRNDALDRLKEAARDLGANAVIAMRFDCNEIGNIMSEIAAYGTAVTIEPTPTPA
jgi:uncharacterized protein YbjQ (UPF0145 family)